ncbi:hypothetical protein MTR67_053010 [Solanum verrucosum]|uniref:Mediator of RNA polymerase II transcription subunit 20 n=1 Tax=Solanum verrucosum TaxID=315347 RepID=A0AAF0V7X4_SOLVR|nr:hypothetical protein MTR67_053010 [Solanum verrucosum]
MALSRQRLVVEAESSMQTIMENLQSYRMKLAVNCEEFQYRLGDFRLRVDKAVSIHSENLRGIVMEGYCRKDAHRDVGYIKEYQRQICGLDMPDEEFIDTDVSKIAMLGFKGL